MKEFVIRILLDALITPEVKPVEPVKVVVKEKSWYEWIAEYIKTLVFGAWNVWYKLVFESPLDLACVIVPLIFLYVLFRLIKGRPGTRIETTCETKTSSASTANIHLTSTVQLNATPQVEIKVSSVLLPGSLANSKVKVT